MGCVLLSPAVGVALADDEKQAAAPPVGTLIKVLLPIEESVADRVITETRNALAGLESAGGKRIVIYEFVTGRTEDGRGSNFHKASELADFIAGVSGNELEGVTTVAYLPSTIKGHAVLVALAANEIVMHPDARIGEAGIDEPDDRPIAEQRISAYRQIAEVRNTIAPAVALGMLDRRLEVSEVHLDSGAVELLLPDGLAELRKRQGLEITRVETLIAAGEMGLLDAAKARELGFVKRLVGDVRQLALALDLPASSLQSPLQAAGERKAIRIDLLGHVDRNSSETLRRQIAREVARKHNIICLKIDSSGGSMEAAMDLARALVELEREKVLTVAYVEEEAGGAAALVALACDHLVMKRGARLGSLAEQAIPPEDLRTARDMMQEFARARGRSWSLAVATVDAKLRVYRYRREGKLRDEYFCEAELQTQINPDEWIRGDEVTKPDQPLSVYDDLAMQYGLARHVVDNLDQLQQIYGIEGQMETSKSGWVDFLLRWLARNEISWLLLTIAGAALYAELQTPGLGFAGFLSVVLFALFFWAKYLDGTAGALEVILFILGLVFLLIEVFVVPGFGIFGIGGGIMVICSLVLASQGFVIPATSEEFRELRQSMTVVGGAGIGMVALAALIRRYLPRAPVFNRMMLNPPEGEELAQISARESLVHYEHLLEAEGVTTTQLTPSGKARFEGELVDVIADGEVIGRGERIKVVEVRGNRVLVKSLDETV